jgi:hypothetical protein
MNEKISDEEILAETNTLEIDEDDVISDDPLDEDDASRDDIYGVEDEYGYGSDEGLEEYIRETGLYDGNMDGLEKGYDY